MKIAVVFIDAFPFFKTRAVDKISEILDVYELIPGLGYSVNQHYELLYGKTPDDVGFFGEWNIRTILEAEKLSVLHVAIDNFFKRLNLNFFRKVYRRIILGIDDMIPFDKRKYFIRKGKYAFRELAKEGYKFYGQKFEGYVEELDHSLPRNEEKRIKAMFQKMMDISKHSKASLIFSLSILDHIGHKYGPESYEYDALLELFTENLLQLLAFLELTGYNIILFSDHGMSPYEKSVNLSEFEGQFENYYGEKTIYFYDSLHLRIWTFDDYIRCEVEELLKHLPGKIVSLSERKNLGLMKENHGHIIFVLNEGITFHPNYFGCRLMRGYHGYLPECKRQHGIAAFSRKIDIEPLIKNQLISSRDFNGLLKSILSGETNERSGNA